MPRIVAPAALALALGLAFAIAASPARAQDFIDEKLTDWLSLPGFFSYKEGVITAVMTDGVKIPNSAVAKMNPALVPDQARFHRKTFLLTKKQYTDFDLAFKIRYDQPALNDAGMVIRGQLAAREAMVLDGLRINWANGAWGSLHHEKPFFFKVVPRDAVFAHPQDFVDYRVTAVGNRVTVKVNDVTTIDEKLPGLPAAGHIGFMIAGFGKGDYMIRDIRFRDLGKNAKPPAKVKVEEPASPAPARFSKDMTDIFAAISSGYELNDKVVPPGAIEGAISQLKAGNPGTAGLARKAVDLYALREKRTVQGEKAFRTLEERAQVGPAIALVNRVFKGNQGAARMMEDVMGKDAQEEVNKAYALTVAGMEQADALRKSIQEIGQRKEVPALAVKEPIKVFCETTPKTLGSVTVFNQSGRTLRHVVILGRLAVDAERARAAGQQEDLVGVYMLPALGFSAETVAGSRKAGQLRALAAQIDPSTMAYIAELPPGASVRLPLTHPNAFIGAKTAEVTVFSDEVTVLDRRPSNFYEAQVTARYPTHPNPFAKK